MARKERDKEQEKKIKERKRRSKYGRPKLKHARKGMESCIAAVGVFLLLVILLMITYSSKGEAAAIIGAFGIVSAILAGFGVSIGIKGFKERDKNYISCKIGITLNSLIVLLFAAIFIRGLIL